MRERADLPCVIDEAFTPAPAILTATDILFDYWALTTIREELPGRPPVEPYLHGISDWQPPETQVAWREEVSVLTGELRDYCRPEDLLEDYPLKPHELLRDLSDRVFDEIVAISKRTRDETEIWIVEEHGQVDVATLGKLLAVDKKAVVNRIAHCTVLLPPCVGGLSEKGMLDGKLDFDRESSLGYDIADEWFEDKEKSIPRRVRLRSKDAKPPPPKNMRLIRTIDTDPDADEDESREPTGQRYWHWYELARAGDTEGSGSATEPVQWQDHTDAVLAKAETIAAKVGLPSELKQALKEALPVAAMFHDMGKKREVWQRSIGNRNPSNWLAKSGKGMKPYDLCPDYRHEFGSLLDAQETPEFQQLAEEQRNLVLHFIATGHGRGRPHFPRHEAFDLTPGRTRAAAQMACEVARRFARLQRRYGRWGLAHLESLLRAADWAASAAPSANADETEVQS